LKVCGNGMEMIGVSLFLEEEEEEEE